MSVFFWLYRNKLYEIYFNFIDFVPVMWYNNLMEVSFYAVFYNNLLMVK